MTRLHPQRTSSDGGGFVELKDGCAVVNHHNLTVVDDTIKLVKPKM